jgi:hypothetical protein
MPVAGREVLAGEVRHGAPAGRSPKNIRFLQPLAVRGGGGDLLLHLGVIDDAALAGIDQEHPARLQPPF